MDDLVVLPQLVTKHVVDCQEVNFIPVGWSSISHKNNGLWRWNSNIKLYQSKKQQKGSIHGFYLQEELTDSVLSANVLDDLLLYPELIPENLKGKKIFFWGDIYSNAKDQKCVRYLHHDGKVWNWYYYSIHEEFGPDCFAAIMMGRDGTGIIRKLIRSFFPINSIFFKRKPASA